MADDRARDALARLLSGEKLLRSEPRRAYNGADGVPIREERLSVHGDAVITRNSYGAHCLNTPNALFADVDLADAPGAPLTLLFLVIGVAAAFAVGTWLSLGAWSGALALVAALVSHPIARWVQSLVTTASGGPERVARRRIERFARSAPEWAMRLYRTPAGFRVLVTHRPFDPTDPEVTGFFRAIGADPIYARMCANQRCFRARISPKPWRIGIVQHMRPRPGVWPVAPERLAARQAWIDAYEAAARAFASCRYVEALGSGVIHPDLSAVLELHDERSGACTERPIA